MLGTEILNNIVRMYVAKRTARRKCRKTFCENSRHRNKHVRRVLIQRTNCCETRSSVHAWQFEELARFRKLQSTLAQLLPLLIVIDEEMKLLFAVKDSPRRCR